MNEAFRVKDDSKIRMTISQKLKSKYNKQIQCIKTLKNFFESIGECSGLYVCFWGYDDMKLNVIDNYYRCASNIYRIRETERTDCTYHGRWQDGDKLKFHINRWYELIDMLFSDDNIDIHEPDDVYDNKLISSLCLIFGGLEDDDVKELVRNGFNKLTFCDESRTNDIFKLNRYLNNKEFNWIGISLPDLLTNIDKIYKIFN